MVEERDKLKVAVLRQEDWPVRKDVLINKYGKDFKEFTVVYRLITYNEMVAKSTTCT
jgi:hypothetical protein